MSVLLSCQGLSKSYQERTLFEGVTMGIHEGDKIGLIGPNGAGKSTLMKILSDKVDPDDGTVSRRNLLRFGYVPQVSSFEAGLTTEEVVLRTIEADSIDALEEYEKITQASIALSKAGFEDGTQLVETLSGGWKKRLSFACAMSLSPSVLLLDEPTNHLDIQGIAWLEEWLGGADFAWMVVTHDRYFLERIATAIIEVNKCYADGIFRVNGNYSAFLEKKAEYLSAQEQYQASLTNKMKREIEWLRRGPKARTTKAKSRIQDAGKLAEELASVKGRTAQQQAGIDFTATGRRTKELLVAENIEKSMGGRPLLGGLSFKLTAGSRIGMLGANGSGKTTLLRLITGELEPDQGTLKRAEGLKIVTFSQERPPLDQDLSLRQALAPEGDMIVFRDRQIHVASWAKRFLFRSDQLPVKLRLLSGGEQARVHIARLMLEPADLLLLDEPTNDLDIDTLEILEENLLSFPGVLVLVTHDRYLLDRVAQRVLGLTPNEPASFFADATQWQRHQVQAAKRERKAAAAPKTTPEAKGKTKSKGLTYNEKKEFAAMEKQITNAEKALEACQKALEDPKLATDPTRLEEAFEASKQAEANVEELYARWSVLEEKKAAAES